MVQDVLCENEEDFVSFVNITTSCRPSRLL